MADSTGIQWTDATWNPVTGCERISAGCKNCYAERMARRLQAMGQANYRRGFEPTVHEDVLQEPARWRKPRRIFVCSMADLFHPAVPSEFILRVFEVMAAHPRHTFQVLTKRPSRLLAFSYAVRAFWPRGRWPLPNVWLGTSVESRQWVGRLDVLRHVPAALRFASFEPLLEPLRPNLEGIDWAILGGESGPGARPLDLEAVRALLEVCRSSGVPPFVKQLGRVWAQRNYPRNLHGAEPSTWPEDLRIQEFPTTTLPRPTLCTGGPA